ncbi:MAG: hypothetical protein WA713_07815, partial [Candidatus Acidiferrales bacterium]
MTQHQRNSRPGHLAACPARQGSPEPGVTPAKTLAGGTAKIMGTTRRDRRSEAPAQDQAAATQPARI